MNEFVYFSNFITNFVTVMMIIFLNVISHNNFSRNNFSNHDSFIYHGIHCVNIFNISHTNVLSSSDRFYPFSFYFCEY